MNLIFKKIKFAISKFIYFDFQTLNKQMIAFFRTRPGKILLWQKFSETWDSDFNCNGISVFELNHFLLMEMHEILIYSTAWSVQNLNLKKFLITFFPICLFSLLVIIFIAEVSHYVNSLCDINYFEWFMVGESNQVKISREGK